ncbi:MAG: discoidin domain-containing protein [Gemmatimonadetes bacterium]|nr:discoidin domain-containing protein [Gemmatimonadota bacterium]
MKYSPSKWVTPIRRLVLSLVLGLAVWGCSDDPTSPQIVDFIDLRVEEIGPNRAVVRFETSEPTTCEAEFGTAADALDQMATDPSMEPESYLTEHDVPLEDLEPTTHYYVRARAELPSGDVFFSEMIEFSTVDATAGDSLVNFGLSANSTTVSGVSSNFGGGANDSFWGANNAIDGLMSSEWSSNGDGDDAWISLNLGQRRRLSHFEFRSRQMPDGSAIATSVQLVFGDSDPLGPFDTPEPEQVYRFELDGVEADAVRLDIVTSTGGNTGAREIRFLGTP